MSTKIQNFRLPSDLINKIEPLIKVNKTELVIELLNESLAMRELPLDLREVMYAAAKRYRFETEGEESAKFLRTLIDALYI